MAVARYREALVRKWRADGVTDAAHDLAHVGRVWRNVQTIAAQEGGDLTILCPATWFHDAVNLPKDSTDRAKASLWAADWAVTWLDADGFAKDKQGDVHHAIHAHSFSAGVAPRSPEAMILRDADRLDALGAVGIARVFAVSGALGRPLFDTEDPFARRRDLDDTRFAVDHFYTKLLKLKESMVTQAGRAMAEARSARLETYLDWLAEECAP